MGSLAAGGAAATGTGAISSSQAQRDVQVNIAGDRSSNIRIYTETDKGVGDEFVEFGDNGELKLTFDEVTGSGDGKGMGLNVDSVYYFDDLFTIEHYSPDGPLGFYFDRESVPEEITFYNGGDGPVPDDYYNVTTDNLDDAGGSGGASILDSQVTETEYNKNVLRVDVQIDLRDSDRSADEVVDQDDSIVLVAEQP